MQGRQMLLMVAVLALTACGNEEEGGSTAAETAEQAEPTKVAQRVEEEAAEPAEVDNPNTRDIHGLRVTVNDDGTIAIQGADRWGGRLDTTYADATYFRNAVPVLKRSITEEQGTGLDELLETLPQPEATEAPTMRRTPAPTPETPRMQRVQQEAEGAPSP